jgi:hypothetical protein
MASPQRSARVTEFDGADVADDDTVAVAVTPADAELVARRTGRVVAGIDGGTLAQQRNHVMA